VEECQPLAAGYSPPIPGFSPDPPVKKMGSTVELIVVDAETGAQLASVATSKPLDEYSYDQYAGYSPPVELGGVVPGVGPQAYSPPRHSHVSEDEKLLRRVKNEAPDYRPSPRVMAHVQAGGDRAVLSIVTLLTLV